MLLGVMLLYVGAVLVVNGIWLVGQARAAALQPAAPPAGTTAPPAGPAEAALVSPAEEHPTFISNREIAILNVFTGFVAIAAVAAGIYTFSDANGNDASIYLGVDWIAWAVLWFMFFLLLALELPIARITGWATFLVGIGTSWVFAILILQDELSF